MPIQQPDAVLAPHRLRTARVIRAGEDACEVFSDGEVSSAGFAPMFPSPRAELRAFTDAQAWLRVFRLPAYAPDLNPVEGIWSVLKGGVLANLAVASFGHLVQVIRHGLKKIQYRPGLIEGCLAGTGLALEPGKTPVDIVN